MGLIGSSLNSQQNSNSNLSRNTITTTSSCNSNNSYSDSTSYSSYNELSNKSSPNNDLNKITLIQQSNNSNISYITSNSNQQSKTLDNPTITMNTITPRGPINFVKNFPYRAALKCQSNSEERKKIEERRQKEIEERRLKEIEERKKKEEIENFLYQIDCLIRTCPEFDSTRPLNCLIPFASLQAQYRKKNKARMDEETIRDIQQSKRFAYNSQTRTISVTFSTPRRSMKSNNEPRKWYGSFKCPCGKRWDSAHSWTGCWQKCKSCNQEVYPCQQELLQIGEEVSDSKKPHDDSRCQRCRQLKRCCWLEDKSNNSTKVKRRN